MDMNGVDFFSTMQGSRAYFDHPASENRFNSTPYSAFRTAFRETAKISSGLLAISNARNLLNVWCTVGADKKNGDWCIKGARLGAEFGTNSSRNLNLKMINKSNFIKAEFIKAGGKYNE